MDKLLLVDKVYKSLSRQDYNIQQYTFHHPLKLNWELQVWQCLYSSNQLYKHQLVQIEPKFHNKSLLDMGYKQ